MWLLWHTWMGPENWENTNTSVFKRNVKEVEGEWGGGFEVVPQPTSLTYLSVVNSTAGPLRKCPDPLFHQCPAVPVIGCSVYIYAYASAKPSPYDVIVVVYLGDLIQRKARRV